MGTGRGDAFLHAVLEMLAQIADAPMRWPRWRGHAEIRVHAMKTYRYNIFYVPSDERLNVIGVLHQRRDPAALLGRLP